jgi:putative transposase
LNQAEPIKGELSSLYRETRQLVHTHLEDDRPLKAVSVAAGIPFRTAQRWVALYRQFGLAALARKKRTDIGQHREISAKLKEAIGGIALQKPPLPVATICRQARRGEGFG